jgi:hypothetical protein
MKFNLCGFGRGCPHLEILNDKVLIGEEGNLCTLTKPEWNELTKLVKERF